MTGPPSKLYGVGLWMRVNDERHTNMHTTPYVIQIYKHGELCYVEVIYRNHKEIERLGVQPDYIVDAVMLRRENGIYTNVKLLPIESEADLAALAANRMRGD